MLPMKIRERLSVEPIKTRFRYQTWTWYTTGKQLVSETKTQYAPTGTYERLQTVDRSGQPPRLRTKQFIRDNGGPFRVDRAQINRNFALVNATSPAKLGYNFYRYVGDVCLGDIYGQNMPSYNVTGDVLKGMVSNQPFLNDIQTYGPKAIARMSPLSPSATVAQAFGELMFDGLPSLPLSHMNSLRKFKSLGSQYVNVQFGWLPFVQDLRNLYNTWETLDKRLAQIARDNGKPVRRKVVLRNEITNTVADLGVYGQSYPITLQISDPPGPSYDSAMWKRYKQVQTIDKVWASGQFRYYIPDIDHDNRWTDRAKAALFGLNPTPAVLWELMPWSWLIDWFANVGDVLNNFDLNAVTPLIIDYCYVMRHQKKIVSWTANCGPHRLTHSWVPNAYTDIPPRNGLYCQTVQERKERIAASPFGFGLKETDLSASQYAILVALGLSRQNFIRF